MPSSKKKSIKPTTCPACGGVDLVRKITTYPVLLSGQLQGKQIHVGRVALHECLTCGHLMPTPAGQAKVDRNVEMGIRLFLGQLHRPALPPLARAYQTHFAMNKDEKVWMPWNYREVLKQAAALLRCG
jgi:Zn ribbon nucleic-acid-binding protein